MNSLQPTRHCESACYLTEESLVHELEIVVQNRKGPVHCLKVTKEFDFSSGRTDLLGFDTKDDLHAFEAKLTKWRRALEQAGRNTSFAHFTYVVLPSRAAKGALRARYEFQRRGVGLVVLGGRNPRLEIPAKRSEPLLPWLTKEAFKRFNK